jgi:long-chain acyl-CoA synthetase
MTIDEQAREEIAQLPIGEAIRRRAALTPDGVVVREKRRGIYHERTWRQYAGDIEDLAIGLIALGLQAGETVAIMGDPTYRWMLTDTAVISVGAISFGIYTTCAPDEVAHQITTAGATVLVAENQEYVDKFLAVSDRCPTVRAIVVDDTRALFGYDDDRIVAFEEIVERGRAASAAERDQFVRRVGATRPDDTALLVFTSGTTGRSKAAMISSRNFLVGGGLQLCKVYPEITTPGEKRIIAHLSLAHAFERIVALYSPILSSLVVHIGEDLESLRTTLFEVQPYMLHAVPRVWQKMAAGAITDVDRSSPVKRATYRAAMAVARRHLDASWEGQRKPVLALLYALGRAVAFKPMLRKFGLAKARFAVSGGTHIPAEVQRTWQCWGLNLHNILGMTEVGFVAFQRGRFPRPGSVGRPVPDLEIALADDGELRYRGPGVFRGYLGDPAETAAVLASDGWFASGDVGEIDADGDVVLSDRKKDIMITAGGKNLTPSLIENAMKASPYISEFVLIAEGRKFPAGLVEIDADTVGEWARARNLLYTGFTSLTELPDVQQLIAEEIEKGNATLARVEQVKRFRIIPKELDPEEGDTTPTRKVRRKQFQEMFGHLVAQMYAEENAEMAKLN